MKTVLKIEDLQVVFQMDHADVQAVRGIHLELQAGEVLAVVGESGSGKSVTANAILRLLPEKESAHISGTILFGGVDLLQLKESEIEAIRGAEISMIFQDPMTAINPTMRVIDQIMEVLIKHKGLSRKMAFEQSMNLLKRVGIPAPERRARQYPFELSGGMKQRIMIAMALACEPKLLIADEPTTALDVTIQAQILELLKALQRETGTAILLITHDLGIVAKVADRVAVMYAGRIVEEKDVLGLFETPEHPYTKGLLQSVPSMESSLRQTLEVIPGNPPNVLEQNGRCAFRSRCREAMAVCHQVPMAQLYNDYQGSIECFLMHPMARAVQGERGERG